MHISIPDDDVTGAVTAVRGAPGTPATDAPGFGNVLRALWLIAGLLLAWTAICIS